MAHLRTDALSRKDVSHVSGHLGTDLGYLRGPVGSLQSQPEPVWDCEDFAGSLGQPDHSDSPGHPRPRQFMLREGQVGE